MSYPFNITEDGTSGIPLNPSPMLKILAETGPMSEKLRQGVASILKNPNIEKICEKGALLVATNQHNDCLYLGYATNTADERVLCFFSCREEDKRSNDRRYFTVSKASLNYVPNTISGKFGITTYEELYGKVNRSIHEMRQAKVTTPTNQNLQETLTAASVE